MQNRIVVVNYIRLTCQDVQGHMSHVSFQLFWVYRSYLNAENNDQSYTYQSPVPLIMTILNTFEVTTTRHNHKLCQGCKFSNLHHKWSSHNIRSIQILIKYFHTKVSSMSTSFDCPPFFVVKRKINGYFEPLPCFSSYTEENEILTSKSITRHNYMTFHKFR
jgi:hypothetical protein